LSAGAEFAAGGDAEEVAEDALDFELGFVAFSLGRVAHGRHVQGLQSRPLAT
jgi:hypothetical protein